MNIILVPKDTQHQHTIDDLIVIQHIKQVLHANLNDTIKIGIQHGNLGTATIRQMSDKAVILDNIVCETPPPNKLPLTVILALPRPKVLRRLILDMTAMGVKTLYLVNSYRTEKSYWQSPFLNKIDNYILEGLQQSCDTIPLTVHLKKRLKPFVEDELPTIIQQKQAIIAHPYAEQYFANVCQPNQESVIAIGAEGGFIPYEVDLFTKIGFQSTHIGKRILRTENAVSVLCGHFLINLYPNHQSLF